MSVAMQFDESGAGQIEGINDAGIETFAGDHIGSLAREQAQNSLDAKTPSASGPFEVRYQLIQLRTKEIPGVEDLGAVFKKVETFMHEPKRRHQQTLSIVRKGSSLLAGPRVPFLPTSARNTTAFRDSVKDDFSGDWYALTQ